jgi:hypothetical protein
LKNVVVALRNINHKVFAVFNHTFDWIAGSFRRRRGREPLAPPWPRDVGKEQPAGEKFLATTTFNNIVFIFHFYQFSVYLDER